MNETPLFVLFHDRVYDRCGLLRDLGPGWTALASTEVVEASVLARLADLTEGLPFEETDDNEQLIERAIRLAHDLRVENMRMDEELRRALATRENNLTTEEGR